MTVVVDNMGMSGFCVNNTIYQISFFVLKHYICITQTKIYMSVSILHILICNIRKVTVIFQFSEIFSVISLVVFFQIIDWTSFLPTYRGTEMLKRFWLWQLWWKHIFHHVPILTICTMLYNSISTVLLSLPNWSNWQSFTFV